MLPSSSPRLMFWTWVCFAGALAGPLAAQQRGPGRPAAPAGKVIPSIEDFRGGHHVPVLRHAEWIPLPLDQVDFAADTLLIVNGEPITQTDLRRTLCLLMGSNEIDQAVTVSIVGRLCEKWGVEVQVTEEQVTRQFEQQKQILAQTGQQDPAAWEKQIREVFGWDRYVEFQRIQLGFEKLFLPDPPEGFMDAQAEKFAEVLPAWQEAHNAWQREFEEAKRKVQAEGGDPADIDLPPPPQPVPEADLSFLHPESLAMIPEDFRPLVVESYSRGQELHAYLRMGLVTELKRGLVESADIVFEPELLGDAASEILFTVDGEPVRIDQIYPLVESRVQPANQRLALRELVRLRVADIALNAADALASLDSVDTWFEEMRALYANTFIPLANAIFLRGFPNEHHYRRYWRRKISYQKLLEKTLSEEELKNHYSKAGRLFFARGALTADVAFFPIDSTAEAGSPTSREGADQRVAELLGRLSEGESFASVAQGLDTYPKTPGVEHGRFRSLVRNRIRQALHESEYSAFAMGYSLADELFYLSVEAEVVGPVETDFSDKLRGLVLVSPTRFEDGGFEQPFETVRDNVLEDLADVTFARFLNDALASCRIELPGS